MDGRELRPLTHGPRACWSLELLAKISAGFEVVDIVSGQTAWQVETQPR